MSERSQPLAALRGLLDRPLASYYLLLSSAGLLVIIGLVMVFSATMVEAYAEVGSSFAAIAKQATWAVVGLFGFWFAQRLPVRTYRGIGRPLLVVSAILLAVLVVFPYVNAGPLRTEELWIILGPIQVQPSEMAKFALLLWGADLLVRKGPKIALWRELAVPLFPTTAIILVLVGFRDLGTMLIMLCMFMGLLWTAGVRLRLLGGMLSAGFVGAMVLVVLASHRMERFVSFQNPEDYADDWGYQAIQGYYAIADGGWFGVGLGESKQKWEWLPNGHNDFIFALIAEELGLVGCAVILALFAVLTYAGLRIARRVSDPFRRLVAAGATFWLAGQAVINIGGVVGLLPITGVPLPLISDGGSALVVTLVLLGMLASFARAEPEAAAALRARNPGKWVRVLWAPLPPLQRGGDRERAQPARSRSRTDRDRSDRKRSDRNRTT